MKLKHFGLLALLLVGLCGCEEDVSEPTSFDSILNSDSKDNVIYYVTTDNCPLEVDESDFNAPIFKHEYYKDKEYGEIVFMADVTIIGDSAFRDYNTDSPKLKRIKIPDSVTEIGDYAFYYCANLTSLEIPDSVTEIGERAFYMCDSLTSITIPYGVTSIGENAFELCGIINVTIPDSVVEIGEGAFNNCHSLTSLTIGDGITSIGEEVFYGCSSLTSLTIPYGVTEIGSGAFGSCSSLTNIHLPDSVTNIGEIAFAWCESLTTVTIPNGVTEIGQQAFDGCSSLASIYCTSTTPPSGNRSMFDSNDIGRKIYVPGERVAQYKSATYWKDYAEDIVAYDFENGEIFGSVISYTTTDGNIVTPSQYCDFGARIISNTYKDGKGMITFDNSVTLIGEGAFSKCSNLTSITIPESVTIIEECSFRDCSNLKVFSGKFASKDGRCLVYNGRLIAFAPSEISTYTIPNNVTSIGVSAFWGCDLTSITIPDSVTEIGVFAFCGCSSLDSINIPNSVTSIGECAFYDCTGTLTIDSNIIEGEYYPNGDPYGFWGYLYMSKFTNIVIGSNVTRIGNYAFGDCFDTLESVIIGNSVTSIGKRAFGSCFSLTNVTISNSVTSIEDSAFSHCSSLATINIPGSVTSIGENAFYGCTSLMSITIPDSVTSIGYKAFLDCSSLKEVYCKPIIPPIAESYGTFGNNASGRKIYVPAESVEAYKTAKYWSDYADDIVGYDF